MLILGPRRLLVEADPCSILLVDATRTGLRMGWDETCKACCCCSGGGVEEEELLAWGRRARLCTFRRLRAGEGSGNGCSLFGTWPPFIGFSEGWQLQYVTQRVTYQLFVGHTLELRAKAAGALYHRGEAWCLEAVARIGVAMRF
jgi:hypothetical protein